MAHLHPKSREKLMFFTLLLAKNFNTNIGAHGGTYGAANAIFRHSVKRRVMTTAIQFRADGDNFARAKFNT